MYAMGRILPSSSAVDAFIQLCTMGASLQEILPELLTLAALAVAYLCCAIIIESYASNRKKKRGSVVVCNKIFTNLVVTNLKP
jgi:hypothetical protein